MKPYLRAILRNLSLVPDERLEDVLSAPRGFVSEVREKISVKDLPVDPEWEKRGFVTLIRQNWDLLSEDQICGLLALSGRAYRALLTDYDFLDVKLGKKPETGRPVYEPPDNDDLADLARVRDFLASHLRERKARPFDFYRDKPHSVSLPKKQAIPERYISSYSARYTGVLEDDELADYSDEMLERIRAAGVTGVWLHETLRNLTPFEFDNSLSRGWERRLNNLRKLTERAAAHGLHVYLYLNEPRSLSAAFFDRYPDLRGAKGENGEYCLCTSTEATKKYLYSAIRTLVGRAPLLHAIMTITMSENPTHCFAKTNIAAGIVDCPRCAARAPEEVAAEVNNIIAAALRDSGAGTRLIANLWGWSDFMGWTEERTLHGIDLLDPDIDVLCVSEYSKDFVRGGVAGRVVDYSISVVGPSGATIRFLRHAKQKGHRIFAKVQVNNSWECSAVPFLPAFGLMANHVRALAALDVSGIMLGWSLGGYPGGALPLCSLICTEPDYDEGLFYREFYGEDADRIRAAVLLFDRSFEYYPFSIDGLYFGGQTLGPANTVAWEAQDRRSTMVCFTFDDYEHYVGPYGIDGYLSLYEQLLKGWQEGLDLLSGCREEGACGQFVRSAKGAYLHFKSAYLIAKIAKYKREANSREIMRAAFAELRDVTKELYALTCEDATIGFEMSNQYFYTPNRLLEQIMTLSRLAEE